MAADKDNKKTVKSMHQMRQELHKTRIEKEIQKQQADIDKLKEETDMIESTKDDIKNAPFDGAKPSLKDKYRDRFGNKVKDKNIAKHLAKKGRAEAEAKKESVEYEEQISEAALTVDDVKAQAEGKKAARKGVKYDDNPYEKGSSRHLQWSKGHNAARAHGMKEEAEQIDEVSFKTASKVADKRYDDWKKDPGNKKKGEKAIKTGKQAAKRFTKEEAEQIDEISNKLAKSYIQGAQADQHKKHWLDTSRSKGITQARKKIIRGYDDDAGRKATGVLGDKPAKVGATLKKEEVEQIDEISTGLAQRYMDKAAQRHTRAYNQGKRAEKHYDRANKAGGGSRDVAKRISAGPDAGKHRTVDREKIKKQRELAHSSMTSNKEKQGKLERGMDNAAKRGAVYREDVQLDEASKGWKKINSYLLGKPAEVYTNDSGYTFGKVDHGKHAGKFVMVNADDEIMHVDKSAAAMKSHYENTFTESVELDEVSFKPASAVHNRAYDEWKKDVANKKKAAKAVKTGKQALARFTNKKI